MLKYLEWHTGQQETANTYRFKVNAYEANSMLPDNRYTYEWFEPLQFSSGGVVRMLCHFYKLILEMFPTRRI